MTKLTLVVHCCEPPLLTRANTNSHSAPIRSRKLAPLASTRYLGPMGHERTYLIVGNWKMNLALEACERLTERLDKRVGRQEGVEVMLAPSYIALARVSNILRWSRIGVVAQDMSEQESGAFTGDVSADMLLTIG